MRKLIFIVAIFALGCKSKETLEMPGAYNLLSQSVNDGQKDSIMVGVKQLKIYTANHMMYAHLTADSASSFGVGSYSIQPDGVKENIMYTSTDSTVTEPGGFFNLAIEKTPTGYKQVITGIESQGIKYKLTEEYESVGVTKSSPLDGAWKLLKRYSITDKDTVRSEATQFKTYYAGHVVWGVTYVDTLKHKHTGFGYGSFDMTSDSKVKETIEVTSFSSIGAMSFDIDIEFKGPDGYKQKITGTDGVKHIEEYQRLK